MEVRDRSRNVTGMVACSGMQTQRKLKHKHVFSSAHVHGKCVLKTRQMLRHVALTSQSRRTKVIWLSGLTRGGRACMGNASTIQFNASACAQFFARLDSAEVVEALPRETAPMHAHRKALPGVLHINLCNFPTARRAATGPAHQPCTSSLTSFLPAKQRKTTHSSNQQDHRRGLTHRAPDVLLLLLVSVCISPCMGPS